MARSRIRALARTRPWPRVAGFTRKAEAIRRTSMPRMVWRMRGVRMPGSMAGWAQASISASRSSGKGRPAGANRSSASSVTSAPCVAAVACRRQHRRTVAGPWRPARPPDCPARRPRPCLQRPQQRSAEGILGGGEVAATRGEKRQQAPVGQACRPLDRSRRRVSHGSGQGGPAAPRPRRWQRPGCERPIPAPCRCPAPR